MAHTEKTIASQTLFEGRIIEVRRDKVELENGRQSTRELVLHHGGVCVAALDEQDRILLVRQFRYPYGKEIIELPAGKIEKGEDPRECGIRELQEECGCTADRFEKLTELYPTPGYCSEIIHLYQASGLHETQQHLDPGEFLDVLRVPFEQAVRMVLAGEIPDAKTQVGILQLYAQAHGTLGFARGLRPSALPNVGGEAPHGPHERALREIMACQIGTPAYFLA